MAQSGRCERGREVVYYLGLLRLAMPDDDAKKQIRTTLTAKESFLMILMPVSQLVAFGLTYLASTGAVNVMHASCAIGTFYALWAFRNKLNGNVNEKGHFTAGALGVGGGMGSHVIATLGAASVAASIVVVLLKVGPWPLGKMAHVMKKTLVWSGVFKAYLTSMMAQMTWLAVLLVLEARSVVAQGKLIS